MIENLVEMIEQNQSLVKSLFQWQLLLMQTINEHFEIQNHKISVEINKMHFNSNDFERCDAN